MLLLIYIFLMQSLKNLYQSLFGDTTLVHTGSRKKEDTKIKVIKQTHKHLKDKTNLVSISESLHNPIAQDEIKSEVNFLKLPFFSLSRQGSKKPTEIEYRDTITRGDERVDFFWGVSANVKYGYPSVFDKKVFKAIEQIINQNGWPVQNPVKFSLYQICKILNIGTSGKNKNAIKEALERIRATNINCQGAFYQKSVEEQLYRDSFNLYSRVTFREQKLDNGNVAETNYLFLGDFYLESLNSFYVKTIDFKYYQSLKSNVARRLYEILDIKFYNLIRTKRHSVFFDYQKLCALLPVKQQKKYSDATRYLKPAHDELIRTTFLRAVKWTKVSKSEWKVEYFPSKETMQKIKGDREVIDIEPEPPKLNADIQKTSTMKQSEKTVGAKSAAKRPTHPKDLNQGMALSYDYSTKNTKSEPTKAASKINDPLIPELTKRGITKNRAPKLISDYKEKWLDSDIMDVLECFDHKDKQGEFINAKNKAGLLVNMIKENNCEAQGYKTRAERAKAGEKAEKQKQFLDEREEQEKLKAQREWEALGTVEAKTEQWWKVFSFMHRNKLKGADKLFTIGIKETVKDEIKKTPHKPPSYQKYAKEIFH
jgi:hypothetical protein